MFQRIPLDEPIKTHWVLRFFILFLPCLFVRFAVGPIQAHLGILPGSFYWFGILYFPMTNWTIYWVMFTIRVGINRIAGNERITVPKLRKFYRWYLNVPGGLVLSELVFQGYLYNAG